jgi:hypothetical protein
MTETLNEGLAGILLSESLIVAKGRDPGLFEHSGEHPPTAACI